jgi:hypothetical protein
MSRLDFVNSLSQAENKGEDSFVVGMAKLDGSTDAIMFGPTHKCGPWTKIPLSAIKRVVPIATCSCREHEHPVVALYFKDKNDPVSAALGQLLRNMQKELFSQMSIGTSVGVPGIARTSSGGTGPADAGPTMNCLVSWIPACWEVDFSGDVPTPSARPGIYQCVLVPILICVPA